MAPTSRDVAKLAGVSQPTVSRVFNNDPLVAVNTREKVLVAAATLKYVPHETARNLVTRKTRRVGLVVSDLANPFYPNLIAPLHDELARLDYRMTVITEKPGREGIDNLPDGSVDGFVLLTSELNSQLPLELARRSIPFVYLNRYSETVAADSSVVDNAKGGMLAAQVLAAEGHTKIAAIFGPPSTSTSRDRERGFIAQLSRDGLSIRPNWRCDGDYSYENGFSSMRHLWRSRSRPTAVFCGNDIVAIGALDAAAQLSLDVPGEVSILGFDDIPMAAWNMLRLTTIGHDLNGMATGAASLLVSRLEGDREMPIRQLIAEPTVVRRRSVGPPRD